MRNVFDLQWKPLNEIIFVSSYTYYLHLPIDNFSTLLQVIWDLVN